MRLAAIPGLIFLISFEVPNPNDVFANMESASVREIRSKTIYGKGRPSVTISDHPCPGSRFGKKKNPFGGNN
jgi:hypothetical protein